MRDEAWVRRRKALHKRYLDVAKVGDASRLAFLHGPPRTWSEEEVADLWRREVQRQARGGAPTLNCVYVHVPFCKSLCHFCNYDRLQPSSPALLTTWLARVRRTMEVLAPAVRPLKFHTLYIGGGTPSVLPARMMRELLTMLEESFTWHPLAIRRFELDPAVISRERLEVLAEHRFRELSFGIETLDPETNLRHNRGRQDVDTIERCFTNMRSVGISNIACDFLLGLEGTTPEGMLVEMETVLTRFRPKRLDIYMLTPTHPYVKQHFGDSWDAYWAHIRRFDVAIPPALAGLAARTGYRVHGGSAHHIVLENRRGFDLRSTLDDWGRKLLGRAGKMNYTPLVSDARRPLNVLGMGRSARSSLFSQAAFASRDPGDDPSREGPPDYAGDELSLADEVRSFLAHIMRESDAVDRDEFRWIFGEDIQDIIPEALEAWAREGTARLDKRELRLVPQERHERLRTLLWLVPEQAIEFDLGHQKDLVLSPEGVARILEDMPPGTPMAGGHVFEGTDGIHVVLRTPEGESVRLRVAPELNEGEPLRLVRDGASMDNPALDGAIAQLQREVTARHRLQVRQIHSLPLLNGGQAVRAAG